MVADEESGAIEQVVFRFGVAIQAVVWAARNTFDCAYKVWASSFVDDERLFFVEVLVQGGPAIDALLVAIGAHGRDYVQAGGLVYVADVSSVVGEHRPAGGGDAL